MSDRVFEVWIGSSGYQVRFQNHEKLDEEWRAEYRSMFYPHWTLSDHAKQLAYMAHTLPSQTFFEGYGPIESAGFRKIKLTIINATGEKIAIAFIYLEHDVEEDIHCIEVTKARGYDT
jgi:hypothetical protein